MVQFQERGEIHVLNLCCRLVNNSHTAFNIKGWMKEIFECYEIEDNQILVIAVDSAANIQKAAREYLKELKVDSFMVDHEPFEDDNISESIDENHVEYQEADPTVEIDFVYQPVFNDDEYSDDPSVEMTTSFPQEIIASSYKVSCVVHQLQLAINKFFEDDQVAHILSTARNLSAKLRNQNISRMLRNENFPTAIMDQATRWSSTSLMIQRLESLQPFCSTNGDLFKGLDFLTL